jgi:hypothetical protein
MGKWILMTEIGEYHVSPDGKGLEIDFPDGEETRLYHEQFKQLQAHFVTFVRSAKPPSAPTGAVAPQPEPLPPGPVGPESNGAGPVQTNGTTVIPSGTEALPRGTEVLPRGTEVLPPAAPVKTIQGREVPVMGMREVPTPPEHLPPGVTREMDAAARAAAHVQPMGGGGRPSAPRAPQNNAQTSIRRHPSLNSQSMSRRPQTPPPARGMPNPHPAQAAPHVQTAPRQGQPQPVRPTFQSSFDRMTKGK